MKLLFALLVLLCLSSVKGCGFPPIVNISASGGDPHNLLYGSVSFFSFLFFSFPFLSFPFLSLFPFHFLSIYFLVVFFSYYFWLVIFDQIKQWVSGGYAPQWVEIDLGTTENLAYIKLIVSQAPFGPTIHNVFAGTEPAPTALLAQFSGNTLQGQQLQAWLNVNARYVRVQTTSSPSWVAWQNIIIG